MSSLYVIRGKDNGTHFPIRGAIATLGRGANCTIRLNDTEVSRQHAKITRSGDQHQIVDNGSSNGTFVNSRRITRQVLRGGDRVQVGRTLLIYTGGPEPHDSSDAQEFGQGDIAESVEVVTGDVAELSRITGSLESRPSITSSSVLRQSEILPNLPPARRMNASIPAVGTEPAAESDHPERRPAEERKQEDAQSPDSRAETLSGLDPSNQMEISSVSFAQEDGERADPSSRSVAAAVESEADWETVFRVSQAVRRTVDLGQLLGQILDLIFDSIPCDRGCILMFDSITGELRPTCSRERSQSHSSALGQPSKRLKISQTILDHVVQLREGVLTSNAQDDARWSNVESIASIGINEAICVPMLGRYGPVGTVYVDTTQTPGNYASGGLQPTFDKRQLRLMMAIANQAALAIEDTQFYQAMLQSERLAAMGQTIANLSHHVKNVLQGIQGGAFLVDDGLKKEKLDVVSRGWTIVQRNQERISNLVMDMLSFSKDREPEHERSDVVAFVAEIIELLSLKATDLGVALSASLPSKPIEADFDNEGMHRAILNVLLNAVEATSQSDDTDPRVNVAVQFDERSENVNVIIADNGPGIADEDIGRIFAPFESSKGARGTGLGLPVSQKILREHGGDILVKSNQSDSAGTQFTLYWPSTKP